MPLNFPRRLEQRLYNLPPLQLVYYSAERAPDRALNNDRNSLHQRMAAIVVDESHTVETYTGQR